MQQTFLDFKLSAGVSPFLHDWHCSFSFEGYGNPQGGGSANLVSFPFVFGTTGGVSVAEDVATFWLLAITLLLIAAAKTVSARTIHAADLGS